MYNELTIGFDLMTSKENNTDSNNTGTIIEEKIEVKKPSFYQVLIMNDDYTPMEFVILVLEKFFKKSRTEATQIMLHVHQKGMGVCGLYPYEVAETKVVQVMDYARKNEHPLQCAMEKE